MLLPTAAMAVLQDEIQVYDDEINAKGEQSLELHVNNTPRGIQTPSYPGEVMNNSNTRITPEYAYGLGHDLEAGFYINSVVNNSTWNYAGAKVRLKWLPYTEEKGDPVFAGLNVEVSNTLPQYEPSRYNSEARFIQYGNTCISWSCAELGTWRWILFKLQPSLVWASSLAQYTAIGVLKSLLWYWTFAFPSRYRQRFY